MRLNCALQSFLKTVLVAAFILAGGSFSHSLAEMTHDHALEVTEANGHIHDHVSADTHAVDHETVHCGAYLLALTCDYQLLLPEPPQESVRASAVSAVSRSGKIEPPPPRPVSLSI